MATSAHDADAASAAEFRPRRWAWRARRIASSPISWLYAPMILDVIWRSAGPAPAYVEPWAWLFWGPIGIVLVTLPIHLFYQYRRDTKAFTVRVTAETITGPLWGRGWHWDTPRATVPLASFDRVRNARRTKIERVFGWQTLWDAEDRLIRLPLKAFAKIDRRRLLATLGLDQQGTG